MANAPIIAPLLAHQMAPMGIQAPVGQANPVDIQRATNDLVVLAGMLDSHNAAGQVLHDHVTRTLASTTKDLGALMGLNRQVRARLGITL